MYSIFQERLDKIYPDYDELWHGFVQEGDAAQTADRKAREIMPEITFLERMISDNVVLASRIVIKGVAVITDDEITFPDLGITAIKTAPDMWLVEDAIMIRVVGSKAEALETVEDWAKRKIERLITAYPEDDSDFE